MTDATGSEVELEVREGRLVIFPAWLEHSVAKSDSEAEGERISVAFNIMLSDYAERYGRYGPPRWSRRPSL